MSQTVPWGGNTRSAGNRGAPCLKQADQPTDHPQVATIVLLEVLKGERCPATASRSRRAHEGVNIVWLGSASVRQTEVDWIS